MNRDLIEQLEHRLKELNEIIHITEQQLTVLPSDALNIRQENNKTYYYVESKDASGKHRTPIKDPKQIHSLAQHSYLVKVMRSSISEKRSIEQFLGKCNNKPYEDIYGLLPESRRNLITPVRLTDEQYTAKWLSTTYAHKPFSDGDPYFETERGERVRSKSEQLIANRLNSRGIPYKFECPLLLGGQVIHPDFTILRLSDRKELYYEHLGKMGDEDYAYKTIRRINNYTANGIILGDRLFTTMESNRAPFDIRTLDKMIDINFR